MPPVALHVTKYLSIYIQFSAFFKCKFSQNSLDTLQFHLFMFGFFHFKKTIINRTVFEMIFDKNDYEIRVQTILISVTEKKKLSFDLKRNTSVNMFIMKRKYKCFVFRFFHFVLFFCSLVNVLSNRKREV